MSPYDHEKIPISVWCPLIPLDEYDRLKQYERHLGRISQAYDDWLASMRGKPFIGTDLGVLLDRIRMLMINIGVACADDRQLAETFQSILSSRLRKTALKIVKTLPDDKSNPHIKRILKRFFEELRFTRDISPYEEMEKAVQADMMTNKGSNPISGILSKILALFQSQHKESQPLSGEELIEKALVDSSNVMKRIYIKLLSPDPWGNNLHS
ncbi:MAG: hypothetical protein K9W43_00440 [Candidatus Thorarchaeota archaeon]|nr:hypothetical protein [Candidatus Thorarchaeota archaeon]